MIFPKGRWKPYEEIQAYTADSRFACCGIPAVDLPAELHTAPCQNIEHRNVHSHHGEQHRFRQVDNEDRQYDHRNDPGVAERNALSLEYDLQAPQTDSDLKQKEDQHARNAQSNPHLQKSVVGVWDGRPELAVILQPAGHIAGRYAENEVSRRGADDPDDKICWRVEATDSISTPGILEVIAVEYYANKFEDDMENGVVGGLIEPIEEENTERINLLIKGDSFIKPKGRYRYTYTGLSSGEWSIDTNKYPVKILFKDERNIEL